MRLRFTLPALDDLDEILGHIDRESPLGARKVKRRIQQVCNLLTTHPKMGTRTEDLSIRRVVVTPYPFLVFYEIGDDEVIVHAIRHGARAPEAMPGSKRD